MPTETDRQPCHVQWGDRIDHRIFGFGTVVGEPIPVSGPIEDRRSPGGYRIGPKGYQVPVKWDDPNREFSEIGCSFLELVIRPDAKGSAFWKNEYEKLLADFERARQATDMALRSGFRSEGRVGKKDIEDALQAESEPLRKILAFLAEDEDGEHP